VVVGPVLLGSGLTTAVLLLGAAGCAGGGGYTRCHRSGHRSQRPQSPHR
jgi:hypothetical protein